MLITSPSNARIRLARQLLRRKGRQKTGRWLVEGVRALEEALRHGAKLETLFVTQAAKEESRVHALLQRAASAGADIYTVTDELLLAVSDTQTPQGVVGIALAPSLRCQLFEHSSPWVLVVDRIQDPGNLGTLCRTALAAAATGVALLHGTVDPGNPKVIRASSGAVFGLPLAHLEARALVEQVQRSRVRLITADLAGTQSIYDVDWTVPTALVVGNEAQGPSPLLKAASDVVVRIPMPGPVESLNVAIATALCLFEGVRQRLRG